MGPPEGFKYGLVAALPRATHLDSASRGSYVLAVLLPDRATYLGSTTRLLAPGPLTGTIPGCFKLTPSTSLRKAPRRLATGSPADICSQLQHPLAMAALS